MSRRTTCLSHEETSTHTARASADRRMIINATLLINVVAGRLLLCCHRCGAWRRAMQCAIINRETAAASMIVS